MTSQTLTFLEKVEQNLPVTAQEVFDHSVNGVIQQGHLCYVAGKCFYRDAADACAAGHCLPAAFYTKEMEGKNVERLQLNNLLPASLIGHVALLADLQSVHDDIAAYRSHTAHADQLLEFRTRALGLAQDLKLSTANIIEI